MSAMGEGAFQSAAVSRAGRRPSNEDAASVWTDPTGNEPVRGYAIVCDGMGGHNAGEVASNMTVRFLQKKVEKWSASLREATLPDPADLVKTVEEWIREINLQIRDQGLENLEQRGMGTTLAMVLALKDGHILAANIGDSKIFHLQGLRARQLSVDHTAIAEQRRALNLDNAAPEDLAGNPFAHALTRSLGQEDNAQPDINPAVVFKPGDLVILTSDGVTDVLESERFMTAVETSTSIEGVAEAIYKASYDAGSKDNITVVLISNGAPARLGLAISNPADNSQLDETRPMSRGAGSTSPSPGTAPPSPSTAPLTTRPDRERVPRPVREQPKKAGLPLLPIVTGASVLLIGAVIVSLWISREGTERQPSPASVVRPPTPLAMPALPASVLATPTLPAVPESSPAEAPGMIQTSPPSTRPAMAPITLPTVPSFSGATPRIAQTAAAIPERMAPDPDTPRPEAPDPVALAPAPAVQPSLPTDRRPTPIESAPDAVPLSGPPSQAVVERGEALYRPGSDLLLRFYFDRPVQDPGSATPLMISGCKVGGDLLGNLPELQSTTVEKLGARSLQYTIKRGSIAGTVLRLGSAIDCKSVSGPFTASRLRFPVSDR